MSRNSLPPKIGWFQMTVHLYQCEIPAPPHKKKQNKTKCMVYETIQPVSDLVEVFHEIPPQK